MRKISLLSAFIGALLLAFCGSAFALVPNTSYTIGFYTISSAGVVNTTASTSTTATSDSNGLVTFSTLSGLPDNNSCYFMVSKVYATSGGSPSSPDLESIVPCPTAGTTMPLGISGITNDQAQALISAFQTAGTDDPILGVFGYAAVQTSGISASDLDKIATYAYDGISNSGGFVPYLMSKLESKYSITSSAAADDLNIYRQNIVAGLANASSGYSALIKASVAEAAAGNTAAAAQNRAKAAAAILENLITATQSQSNPLTYGIHAGWVMEAIDKMGQAVVPNLQNLSSTAAQAVQSSIGSGLQVMQQQVAIQQYSNAMSTLGASGADVTQFQNAAAVLSNAVDSAMQTFNEQAFPNGIANTPSAINTAQGAMNTTMMNAFSAFQKSMGASSQEIGNGTGTTPYSGPGSGIGGNGYPSVTSAPSSSMIYGICQALGNPSIFDSQAGANEPCDIALEDMDNQMGIFKWYSPAGQTNWPVNMVALVNWISNKVAGTGGALHYTRDTTGLTALESYPGDQFFNYNGYCHGAGLPSTQATCQTAHGNWVNGTGPCVIYNQSDCTTASGTWSAALTCFGPSGTNSEPLAGEAGYGGTLPDPYCQGQPDPYWIFFAIQQDIWMEQDLQNQTMQAGSNSMSAQQSAQQNLDSDLSGIASAISGNLNTANGGAAITGNQKKAIMELMSPPQM